MRRIFFIVIFAFSVTLIAFAQGDVTPADDAVLILTLGDASCSLVMQIPDNDDMPEVTPEITAEPDEDVLSVLTLGDDCETLIPDLLVAANGTLWLALSVPDEDEWQTFAPVPDDTYAPQFDLRGRYVGCANRQAGEQVCALLWEDGDITYRVEIPIFVGEAYIPPAMVDDATSDGDDESALVGWGACGSCDSCGASPDQCVTTPDRSCVADPATCAPVGAVSSPADNGQGSDSGQGGDGGDGGQGGDDGCTDPFGCDGGDGDG